MNISFLFTTVLIFILTSTTKLTSSFSSPPPTVCIIGSGIGGSSVAHFLRRYSNSNPYNAQIGQIRIFERNAVVGGRMATVNFSGETFEAGASILHPKNYHALDFVRLLNLSMKDPGSRDDDLSLGIWNGKNFVFKTFNAESSNPISQTVITLANKLKLFFRYGLSLLRMSSFVEETVDRFLKYYKKLESRPVFESVEDMLKWAGLYNLTKRTLGEELADARLSPLLIKELATVITRINYGQSVGMSGLAGAVSLAGSGGGLWSIQGGNWQMAAGLIDRSNVELHLQEEITSVSYIGGLYELNSTKGGSYACEVTVVATPLDELSIDFRPDIFVPEIKMQHTFTTFVRGVLNPEYFGLKSVSDLPELVGTTETPDVPFSSINILKKYDVEDMTYKVFSRQVMAEELLDQIFSLRKETVKIDWAAYPRYHAPETFAPLILDDQNLYYVNAFENAASTMETSAVSAENIARLILARHSSQGSSSSTSILKNLNDDTHELHSDL